MKVSFAKLAPAREIILSWMDDTYNNQGIAFMHHENEVVIVGYNYIGVPQLLAVTLDTYDFEPFKPFLLRRDESEFILNRSVYSGIHQMTDMVNLANVREIVFSGIGNQFTVEAVAPALNCDLPLLSDPAMVWLKADLFERVCEMFGGFSNGEHATQWGVRFKTSGEFSDCQITAGRNELVAFTSILCSRKDGNGVTQAHIPEPQVSKLLANYGSSQVAIAPGQMSSGAYSWTRLCSKELPNFDKVLTLPRSSAEITWGIALDTLMHLLGDQLLGPVRLNIAISDDGFCVVTAYSHMNEQMNQLSMKAFCGKAKDITITLDRRWLNQAWEILGGFGSVNVLISGADQPISIICDSTERCVVIAPMMTQP